MKPTPNITYENILKNEQKPLVKTLPNISYKNEFQDFNKQSIKQKKVKK